MDKIDSVGIQRSQLNMMQEMQRMSAMSGAEILPAANVGSASQTQGVAFSQVFNGAINHVDGMQHKASEMQTAIDMGTSDNLMETMVESQKAGIAFSAMMEVRNKLTHALDQVMNISL
ncbi:flagellar hook-basal body complex protein FliE [Pragia fontium]|uniref:Flagellar hook-basal body complex protein FliE n=2 Tax=Pragia fontium TaxID=82985 RepID=A0AAJ4W7Q9_9GAMM|nr:flagellar hook-basal body complex protein FliE [Pragia fontium]AKJ41371.1 flagellar hook-basal body protein FliE [Pragia fontium]SFC02228.1 flagellar hook-basal body complex protein FliE [Pragia fontium DSM 5563 = ATCC 49100]SUB81619.1 flagellar hook-basal body protein FliE [Pragia fontium]VEJ54078.1 flagellar hook-basal body protein FliE [Pragia fontium]GKX62928.1 flagellar hook-basal body complex protein FliE [Pragia fontium]